MASIKNEAKPRTTSVSRIFRKSSRGYSRASIATLIKQPILRYLPTYRLEPTVKFNREICENIIKKILESALDDFVYSPKNAQIFSRHISEEIQNRVLVHNFTRYKIVCVVTIVEKFYQDCCAVVKFLWDAGMDQFVSQNYDTPKFLCSATLYAVYYD